MLGISILENPPISRYVSMIGLSTVKIKDGVPVDEPALIEQAKQDNQYFGVIYDHYFDAIYSYIFYKVLVAEIAEDLTSKTFMAALAKLDSYEDRQKGFSAWLYTIARNEIVSHHRRNWWRSSLDLFYPESNFERSVESQIERDEQQELLTAAFSLLTKRDQDVIELYHLQGLSAQETGDILHDTAQNITNRAFRARKRLLKFFTRLNHGEEVIYV